MPAHVFQCEGCGGHKPFLVHDAEVSKTGIQKHCPTCRTMTQWVLAFPERRAGGERRMGSDRRALD